MLKDNWIYRRGDIYLADLGRNEDSLLRGIRPVIVLQNNAGNKYSPLLTVVPVTSNTSKKPGQPTHFLLRKASGLCRPSVVQAEQIGTFSKKSMIRYLGRVNEQQLHGIERAVRVQLGLRQTNIGRR